MIECCIHSRQSGETLPGTATRVDAWYLLEYDHRWESKALKASTLPDEVKEHLSDDRARVQFIRQHPRTAPEGLAFYVALSREVHPVLYRFALNQVEDLLELDLNAVLNEDAAFETHKTTDPLYIVCTNGRRDPCCAAYGPPVYEHLSVYGGSNVWQTTHVGGHRFAANVVCLPHGLYYGRVEPDRAPALVEAYQQHRLIVDIYRGRSCYEEPVQAADTFLRIKTGITHLDAFRLIDSHQETPDCWVIQFAADSDRYTVRLGAETILTLHSCADTEPSPSTHYHLIDVC